MDIINVLKLLTGISQSESLIVDVNSAINPTDPSFYSNNSGKHTDLLLLDKQLSINHLSQKNTTASFLPSLSAYGIANSTFFGQGGENSVFKQAPGYWLGLQLNWNIYDGNTRKSKLAKQKLESQKLAVQTFQVKESIQMNIDNASRKFRVETSNLETTKAQVELAERKFTIKPNYSTKKVLRA